MKTIHEGLKLLVEFSQILGGSYGILRGSVDLRAPHGMAFYLLTVFIHLLGVFTLGSVSTLHQFEMARNRDVLRQCEDGGRGGE